MNAQPDTGLEVTEQEWQATEEQKAALACAFVLRQRCLMLGIEWDRRVLRKDLTLNTRPYNRLRLKMGRALVPKLAHDLNRQDAWESAEEFWVDVLDPDNDWHRPCLTFIELIRLAMQTGWIRRKGPIRYRTN